jgi:mono/diheme cytochrome c family protein
MRERLAIIIAFLTVCFAISISGLFAWKHNVAVVEPAPRPNVSIKSDATEQNERSQANKLVRRGRTIYEAKHCQTCHSIGGAGNPGYPLDGVGSKLNRTELREAIIGTGPISSKMSGAVRQRKTRYAEMPEDDMSKLIDYLSTLVLSQK